VSEPRSLYEYYERQTILPTHASFETPQELARYAAARAGLFEEKLALPVRLFAHADVLEFGPDSGENSLVFALWGARLTLCEPNAAALPAIRAYFARFHLEDRLSAIASNDVLGFPGEGAYDLIDAEGFIYTVPTRDWVSAFARLMRPGGWFVVSYYERAGALIELFLRALHAETMRRSGWDALETAHRLYDAKWNAIPHTRAFESWVMDVLRNPFVRPAYFIDAADLWSQAVARGFALYSSWPLYRDGLQVGWHKRRIAPEEDLRAGLAHLRRSALSFIAGEKVYLPGDDAELEALAALVTATLASLDAMVTGTRCASTGLDAQLAALESFASQAQVIEDLGARARLVAALAALREATVLAGSGDIEGLCRFTSSDAAFLRAWGMPAHFAVFRSSPA
jgi:SAM-dependent methyltransferase